MSKSVDNRVVQMQFDNSQFEKGVNTSINSLKKLENSLQFQNGTKGLDNISKAASKVDMSSLSNSVEQTGRTFSNMEIMATTALANITNSIVNVGKSLVSNLISPITSGGLTRALNLEQANFQLSGLGIEKTDASSTSYDEVMNAVLGTAYSYDVAAKAASQLAASDIGVTNAEVELLNGTKKTVKYMTGDMTNAILGIAGVASMTGSSFEDISEVFTRVAGQGKLMSQDLNSISARGLNAAATLAKYLGKTEAEVREMVTKGEIDFNTFSKAMTEAFGEHAKDSTKTFSGALEDVKAALARIGADFYGPALTAARDMLNALTPLVDVVHDKIGGALEDVTGLMTKASEGIVAFTNIVTFASNALPAVSNLEEVVDSIDFSIINNGLSTLKESGVDVLPYLSKAMEKVGADVSDLDKRIADGSVNYAWWISALRDAKSDLTELSKTSDEYADKLSAINDLISETASTVKRLEKVGDFLGITKDSVDYGEEELIRTGIAANDLYKIVGDYLGKSVKETKNAFEEGTISLSDFRAALEDYRDVQNGFTAEQAEAVTKVIDIMDNMFLGNEKLNGIIEQTRVILSGLGKTASKIYEGLSALGRILFDVFSGVVQIALKVVIALTPLWQTIYNIIAAISDGLVALDKAKTVGNGVTAVVNAIGQALDGCGPALTVFTKAWDIFTALLENAWSVVNKFVRAFKEMAASLVDVADTTLIALIESLGSVLEHFFQILSSASLAVVVSDFTRLKQLLNHGEFANLFEGFGTAAIQSAKKISDAYKIFMKYAGFSAQQKAQANILKALGLAILEIAVAFTLLGRLDTENIIASATAIAVAMKILLNSVTLLTKNSVNVFSITTLTGVVIGIATAVLILATAMKTIGDLSIKDTIKGVAAVTALMYALITLTKPLTTVSAFGIKQAKVAKGLTGMIAIAIAIRILADTLVVLSEVKGTSLAKAGITLLGIFTLLGYLIEGLAKAKFDTSQGTAIMKMAAGLVIFAVAIKLMTSAIQDLGSMSWKELITGVGGLMALLASISVFMSSMTGLTAANQGLISVAGAMAIMGVALNLFAASVKTLGGMKLENLAKGLYSVLAFLGGVLAITQFTGGNDLIRFSQGLVILSAGLLVFAVAVKTIANIPLAKLAKAVVVLAGSIAALVIFAPALNAASVALMSFGSAMLVFGAGVALLGVGITSISIGLSSLATSLTTLPLLIESMITGLITGLVKSSTQIVDLVVGTATGIIQKLAENFTAICEAFGLMLDTLLITLGEKLPSIYEFIFTAIYEFLVAFNERVYDFVTVGVSIVVNIINGIAEKIPELVQAGFNLIISFINGLATAIDNNTSVVLAAIGRLILSIVGAFGSLPSMIWDVGVNIIKGLWQGAESMIEWAVKQFKSLGKRIIKAIEKALGIASPSKEFAKVGKYSVEGLVQGLNKYSDKAVKASEQIGKDSLDAMRSAISDINSVTDGLEANPTISPVLDMSNLRNGVSALNSMFSRNQAMSVSSGFVSSQSKWEQFESSMLSGINDAIASNVSSGDNAVYSFNTTVDLDGKAIAKGTATYTQQELNRLQIRSNRKLGLV